MGLIRQPAQLKKRFIMFSQDSTKNPFTSNSLCREEAVTLRGDCKDVQYKTLSAQQYWMEYKKLRCEQCRFHSTQKDLNPSDSKGLFETEVLLDFTLPLNNDP